MGKTKTERHTNGLFSAVKTITKSVREYKKPSFLAPIFVAIEVVLECFIPYIMTLLLEDLKVTPEGQLLSVVLKYGVILLSIAFCSMLCG